MEKKQRNLYEVFTHIRTCFNQLKALAEQLHSDLGVNPSMRAVMEALATVGKSSVPEIAKRKGVSRQHIQTIMNTLVLEGLVKSFDNPAHKRSPLFGLTTKGRKTFATICEREEAPLRRLAEAVPEDVVDQARKGLLEFGRHLENEIKGDKRYE